MYNTQNNLVSMNNRTTVFWILSPNSKTHPQLQFRMGTCSKSSLFKSGDWNSEQIFAKKLVKMIPRNSRAMAKGLRSVQVLEKLMIYNKQTLLSLSGGKTFFKKQFKSPHSLSGLILLRVS